MHCISLIKEYQVLYIETFIVWWGRGATPPWPFPSPDEKEGGLISGPAPPPNKNLPTMETTAKEVTSTGRRTEADHANGSMTEGYQSREDVSGSIADRLTPKRRTRVGFFNV